MARAKLPNGLTRKQETFSVEFFKNGGHASNAYRFAYTTGSMTSKTINECASRLLRDRKLAARLETLQRAVANRAEIKQADILLSARRAMNLNPTKILSPNGNYLPHTEWPEDINLCIDSFEVKQIPGTDGEVVKVKFSSRTAAREQLMKYAGLFAKDNVRRSDGLMAKLDDMDDDMLESLEALCDSILAESDGGNIWENGSVMGKRSLN